MYYFIHLKILTLLYIPFAITVERPKSAMQKAVEDKVFSIKLDDVVESEDEEVDDDGKIFEEELIAHQDESINVYEDKVSV